MAAVTVALENNSFKNDSRHGLAVALHISWSDGERYVRRLEADIYIYIYACCRQINPLRNNPWKRDACVSCALLDGVDCSWSLLAGLREAPQGTRACSGLGCVKSIRVLVDGPLTTCWFSDLHQRSSIVLSRMQTHRCVHGMFTIWGNITIHFEHSPHKNKNKKNNCCVRLPKGRMAAAACSMLFGSEWMLRLLSYRVETAASSCIIGCCQDNILL
jgi:hypothetical protein